MFKTKIFTLFISLLLSNVLFSHLSFANDASDVQPIKIYAASSLTNVLNELIAEYKRKHSIEIIPIYGGSSSLARQIEQGAPADLFISANELWVKHLEKNGVVDKQHIQPFAQNRLVVIAPSGTTRTLNANHVESWLNLLADSRLAVGQTNAVPAGIYAKQSLKSLGMWQSLNKHLAPTSNVRIALTLVERGEANLGIVYQSDAVISNKVRVLYTFTSASHDPIIYPLVTLSQSQSIEQFVAFLLSDSAQEALVKYGFD
ncbi:molybdate ABC transporter substrate-binding protein [Vibrio kasasachensis]|uniref:molybdate ABC transporter substrate-binding protein n=1 Tax=Vibrio kasasachensis TaxID=2910248 RepID=UPI003D1473B8